MRGDGCGNEILWEGLASEIDLEGRCRSVDLLPVLPNPLEPLSVVVRLCTSVALAIFALAGETLASVALANLALANGAVQHLGLANLAFAIFSVNKCSFCNSSLSTLSRISSLKESSFGASKAGGTRGGAS